MTPIFRSITSRSRGFSLVELMVGMLIGMIGIIVMMQVYSVSEGHKRTTTGGDDAQNNGAIALYGIQRDIRQSGFGSSTMSIIGCNVTLRAGVILTGMAPVTINHGSIPTGDANSDTILVTYGSSTGSPHGDGIVQQPAANTYSIMTPASFTANDWVIATPETRASACNLSMEKVVSVSESPSTLTVPEGASGMVSGILFNLGSAPKVLAYAVRNGNLTVCDYMQNDCSNAANKDNAAIWVPIASGIVSMRAQYGRDTSTTMDSIVDQYVATTSSATPSPITPTTACGWMRISAVRIAVVARSGQYDKEIVTAAAPAWAGSDESPLTLTANADWQHYRYKVFQTVMPIRNIAWTGGQSGCM